MAEGREGLEEIIKRDVINPVTYDTLPHSYIAELLHKKARERLFNPNYRADASSELVDLTKKWQKDGAVVVFVSGVFDLLHLDHSGYLLHTKAAGAKELFNQGEYELFWEDLTPQMQQEFTTWALANDKLKLIAGIDGDKSVAMNKGADPNKPGSSRPIYGWGTRAMSVAVQSYANPRPGGKGTTLPIVDAITIHGPHDFDEGSPHHYNMDLVSFLGPDVWVIYGESQNTIEEASRRPELVDVSLMCIEYTEEITYHQDEYIGKMSTSATVRRILGE